MSNCQFLMNRGPLGNWGAALTAHPNTYIGQYGGVLTVTGCLFEENWGDQGCGLWSHGLDLVEVSDCTFIGNVGDLDGGAIYVGSSPAAQNKLIVRRCRFEDNIASEYGGAVFARVAEFVDCDFVQNIAGASGGAIQQGLIFPGECKVTNCRFRENTTLFSVGSAIYGRFEGDSGILNCEFYGNRTSIFGGPGGALAISGAAPVINCAFAGNASPFGAGANFVNFGASATFINCTIASNLSGVGSGAVIAFGTADLTNTIVWGNVGAQVSGNVTASYSCIQNGWTGVGNIIRAPLFVDALVS